MFSVQFLSQRFELTPKQVRDRLTALDGVLNGHVLQGKQNAKLLTDAGLAIFDRLVQMERSGISLPTTVDLIKNDLQDGHKTTVKHQDNDGSSSNIVHVLQGQIEELKHDKEYLKKQLEQLVTQLSSTQEEIRALTAGPKVEPQRLSRWQALRIALLGQ